MEIDSVTKSVLKKSDGLVLNKTKKVTFCNTVKAFVDDPSCTSKTGDESQLKCVEITIVDNSSDHLLPPLESAGDDCNVTDFLVHKVVYDSYVVPDDDIDPDVQNEDIEEESVLFEVQDDDLEFVVHKVTDHEDDLIKQELDFHVVNNDDRVQLPEINTNDVLIQKFSKLSIENILEHDKIIAFIDQKNFHPQFESETSLNISETDTYLIKKEVSIPTSNNLSKAKEELILSPPLQELSLEKIVKAHSDNGLCELDISPLNSIQETDSESDLSSEGTMIMMTSEECHKNEQHIRESFLLYQSMKEKSKTENVQQFNIKSENPITENEVEGKNKKCLSKVPENIINETDAHQGTKHSLRDINLEADEMTRAKTNTKKLEQNSIKTISNINTKNNSTDSATPSYQQKNFQNVSNNHIPDSHGICSNEQNIVKCLDLFKKESLSGSNTSPYWDKSLASIEIPSDVREWKILFNSFEKNSEVTFVGKDTVVQSKIDSNANENIYGIPKQTSNSSHHFSNHISSISKSDELENFVQESTERVERIRKRYLLSGKAQMKLGLRRHSPIRGIRPRFGSTAEILELMQKQNQAPFLSISGMRNHMSWPCNETMSNPEINNKHNSSCLYVSQSLPGVYTDNSFSEYCDEQFNSASSDHYSISSCPSIIIHERGVPEGASPPRSLSEDCNEHLFLDDNPNNVVYYSMKV